MYGIDSLAVSESSKRLICIRDASRNYDTAFWLEDGKKLTLIYPNGERTTQQCKYIEPYHFYFGHTCYHIDQFAEMVKRNNIRLEPEEYVTDLSLFTKHYLDRTLKDSAGKTIPYRSIYLNILENRDMQIVALCPDTQIGRQVAFWDGTKDLSTEPGTTFYSIAQAKEELLPTLDLTIHEQKVLLTVFNEAEKLIPRVSEPDFEATSDNNKSLAARLVDFYKDYNFYGYQDSLEVGDTDEDAIKRMEKDLTNPDAIASLLVQLKEISADTHLDAEQKSELDYLIGKLATNPDTKPTLDSRVKTAADKAAKAQQPQQHTKPTQER